MTNAEAVERHLRGKGCYTDALIRHVTETLEGAPDLEAELVRTFPKNTLLDRYIEVGGYSLKNLGAATMLSRAEIYVCLARFRKEGGDMRKIIEEETEFLEANTRGY